MKKFALAVAFLASAAAAAHAQASKKLYPGNGIDWKSDWEAAVAEAGARNVPILFTIHKDQ